MLLRNITAIGMADITNVTRKVMIKILNWAVLLIVVSTITIETNQGNNEPTMVLQKVIARTRHIKAVKEWLFFGFLNDPAREAVSRFLPAPEAFLPDGLDGGRYFFCPGA